MLIEVFAGNIEDPASLVEWIRDEFDYIAPSIGGGSLRTCEDLARRVDLESLCGAGHDTRIVVFVPR